MKQRNNFLFTCVLLSLIVTIGAYASPVGTEEHFSVKEYSEFHDVLHPLQHEALPNKDFKTIRARAGELTTLGDAIVKLGVPIGVKNTADFDKELKKFIDALAKFKTDAEVANDATLEESYLDVHDSFEMLASMLPRKKQG